MTKFDRKLTGQTVTNTIEITETYFGILCKSLNDMVPTRGIEPPTYRFRISAHLVVL